MTTPSDRVMAVIYDAIGVPDDGSPSNQGRRRKIAEAVEAAWPTIRAQVASEIADEIGVDCFNTPMRVDASWVRDTFVEKAA